MKKIVMTFLTALAAGCADHTMPVAQLPEIDTNNPLLAEWNTPHETPPFDRIRVSDYEPAFDAAIAVSRAEIDAIVNNPAKPTFNNTIVALDRQYEGENETYIEASVENSSSILYDKEIRNKPRTRRTKRNV